MSDDQNREPERGKAPDDAAPEVRPDEVSTEPPLMDEEAVAQHRAAKRARIRKRREEALRQKNAGEGLPSGPGRKKAGKGSALPALRPDVGVDTPALRAERVEAIRRDLVRRRRRKGLGMMFKLWLFVLGPTLVVAWFLWFQASDYYRSEAVFKLDSAEAAAGSAPGGLLGAVFGGGGGGIYDSIAVQNFIMSRDVLRRLDREHAWIAHFQDPDLDFYNSLASDASFEDAYAHYQSMVEVSFDPTEGVIEMSVVASDAEAAQRFSHAIIGYAETMVDQLADPIRNDAIANSERNLKDAEQNLKAAQLGQADVQKKLDTFSVEGEVSAEMSIIAGMETELEGLRGRLTNLRRVTGEDDPRVQRISNQVETLEAQIAQRRSNVTGNATRDGQSLADINAELKRAEIDVLTAQAIFTAAIETREVARVDALRQHRYLSVVVSPSLTDEANYPNKWQTLGLAFLCLLGFYIIASLTISLIREQASI